MHIQKVNAIISICSKDSERKSTRAITLLQISQKRQLTITICQYHNAYINFSDFFSICSQESERKQNSDINKGPYLCTKNCEL